MVPFVHGGAEELFNHLVRNLQLAGAEAEGVRIPFTWNPPERIIDEMLIARNIRLWNVDRVIALKFPSYLVPWDDKILWILHQYRQAYDLFDAGHSNIQPDAQGEKIINTIRTADNLAFAEARGIFTNAPVTAQRLLHYNGVASDILRPPINDPELFRGGESSGYILATGRINAGKRQHLLISALRYAPDAKLVIAGPPDRSEDGRHLLRLAIDAGVDDRVKFELRLLGRSELAGLVNGAVAIAYLPFEEDSLGYCTMEALHAGKAVVTANDSGGVLDIIKDGETGIVAAPNPEAFGQALSRISGDRALASRLGDQGRAAFAEMKLSWPATISRLLS
jgi:glycosyltransferase involved in cell wall biosynthesis